MMRTTSTSRRAAGFTIVELMVVVAIIVLLISIAVPAFNAMTYSTTRSLAENSLRRSITVARDVSLRSSRGGDGAVVFLYEPGGRLSVVAAEQVGSFQDPAPESGEFGIGGIDEPPGGTTNTVERDVFTPSGLAEAIDLPAFWTVRGFAQGALMLDTKRNGDEIAEWYDSPMYGGNSASSPVKLAGNWVFPETGFYDVTRNVSQAGPDVTGRQSFMVRFDARTGAVSGRVTSATFVDPRPSEADRGVYNPADPLRAWRRVDKAGDLATWATRAITDPNPDANGNWYDENDQNARATLIGNRSNDTVLVRPVTRLALADERRLASGIGASGLNRQTNSLYRPYDENDPGIRLDETLFRGAFDVDVVRQNINSWIFGDTSGGPGSARGGLPNQPIGDGEINFDPDDDTPDDSPQASLFSLSPYTGELLELDP